MRNTKQIMKLLGFIVITQLNFLTYADFQHVTLVGHSTSIYCDTPKSWKDVVILWELNGSKILESVFLSKDRLSRVDVHGKYRSSMNKGRSRAELRISNISFEDAGNYTCVIFTTSSMYTNHVLQVQSLPKVVIVDKIQGNSFTAKCCVLVALPSSQPYIEWMTEVNVNFTIMNVVEESRNSRSTVELCSIIHVTVEIIKHETKLTCVTRNNQLNTSSSLSVFDLHLHYIGMLTDLKLTVKKGETATIKCQTGVSNGSLVHLQRQQTDDTWTTMNITSQKKSYRGDLFLYQFAIESSDEEIYRCILARDGEPYTVSDECRVNWKTNVSPVLIFIGVSGLVLCAVAIVFAIHTTFRVWFKSSCPINLNTSKAKRDPMKPEAPVSTLATSDQDIKLDGSRSGDKSNCDNNTSKGLTGTNLTLTNMISQGSRRTRWNGLLFKGTDGEQAIHACTAGAVLSDNKEWLSFSSNILKLPQHYNILRTFEVLDKEGYIYCIQINVPFGSLRNHLEASSRNDKLPTPMQLASYALDVLSGLRFLHSNGWLHPGLCARKVLMTNNGKTCKLYDFCLKSYGHEVMSIISTTNELTLNIPPEAVHGTAYTEYSDVWAVGVLLWEIYSLGSALPVYDQTQPVTTNEYITQMLPMPTNCRSNFYDQMTNCWQKEPESRSSLTGIERTIGSLSVAYSVIDSKKSLIN